MYKRAARKKPISVAYVSSKASTMLVVYPKRQASRKRIETRWKMSSVSNQAMIMAMSFQIFHESVNVTVKCSLATISHLP